jgi:hypothetical protein
MIDVRHTRCEHEGCQTGPSFDIKGGKGRFCVKHKEAGMIDVRHTRCEHEGCDTGVLYGKPGLPISHCFKHRQIGMIRNSNSKCKAKGCSELAIWGTNWKPSHCEDHKTEDDENLVERACISCNLLYVLNKDDKCENCEPVSWQTSRLAKQNALMSYLDTQGLVGSSTDTVVDGGICGKERPDRVYEFCDKIVILECDENQHNNIPCLCEQTRMINISQSYGGIPVYFIRWNPDNYSPENERKFPEVLAKRYKLCADLIKDIKKNKAKLPKAMTSAIYLYYDGWESLEESPWEILASYD